MNLRHQLGAEGEKVRDHIKSVWLEVPVKSDDPAFEGKAEILSITMGVPGARKPMVVGARVPSITIFMVAINEKYEDVHMHRVVLWTDAGLPSMAHAALVRALAYEDTEDVKIMLPSISDPMLGSIVDPTKIHLVREIEGSESGISL